MSCFTSHSTLSKSWRDDEGVTMKQWKTLCNQAPYSHELNPSSSGIRTRDLVITLCGVVLGIGVDETHLKLIKVKYLTRLWYSLPIMAPFVRGVGASYDCKPLKSIVIKYLSNSFYLTSSKAMLGFWYQIIPFEDWFGAFGIHGVRRLRVRQIWIWVKPIQIVEC